MLFPTLDFAVFFFVVFTASWLLIDRANGRKLLLLAASYVFYGWWDWRFLALLAGSSLLNYAAGLAVSRLNSDSAKRWVVGLAVVANLGVLAFFKYFDFFLANLTPMLESVGLERDALFLEIILPVGISFFTFQGISYVVDVYRRDVAAVQSPLDLFLYISFFPQLVAGPIVRAAHFLPQLNLPPRLSQERLAFGLVLIVAGLFKKMVIANYLANEIVDEVFFDPSEYGAIDLWVATYAYAVQIYCDFSGYSDIGIGVAALLGFHFHANFNQPYRASNLQDFWRRWHISLSNWLRDYLYKPLGGSRAGTLMTYRNLMLTMLLGGLWHGAAWTFVIWGAIHGAVLASERIVRGFARTSTQFGSPATAMAGSPTTKAKETATSGVFGGVIGVLLTFHVVCFAWIFFRSENLETALVFLSGLAHFETPLALTTPFVLGLTGLSLAAQFLPGDMAARIAAPVSRLGWFGMGVLAGGAIWFIESVGPEGVAPFIYFQF